MKREGHAYEKTYIWGNMVQAEACATKRKENRHAVKDHIANRIPNMVEIQEGLIDRTIRTGDYKHTRKISGQGKVRDIAKLDFYPSHIYHQCVVLAAEERVERHLIHDTYASRKGKGQIHGALRVKHWLKEHPEETIWFAQMDISKYYENIQHAGMRGSLERIFKDNHIVNALMEPLEKFGEEGMPLGIRPAQLLANIRLSCFDHWVKEELRAKFYIRYMDDFVVFGKTKGKVRRICRMASEMLAKEGFHLHEPKVHRLEKGLSYLGFVFYPGGEMFWRRTNKNAWLKRRSKVSNPRRLQEIDAAAWGMLKHGNKHCKKLYKMTTRVDLKALGIKPKKGMIGKDGKKFFDVPQVSASIVLNKMIQVLDWEKNIETRQGKGRWVLLVQMFDTQYRLIINSVRLKSFIEELEENKVTSFETMMVDRSGNKHYDFDFDRTRILTINNKEIYLKDGDIVEKE
ncbi:MAG: reverse transcriptase domain-containing protein [Proteiniphilum sp.]